MTSLFSSNVLFFSMPSGGEWIIILLVVIIFFGGKKIPELARGVGKGIREFNDAKEGVKTEIENGMKKTEPAQTTTTATASSASTSTVLPDGTISK